MCVTAGGTLRLASCSRVVLARNLELHGPCVLPVLEAAEVDGSCHAISLELARDGGARVGEPRDASVDDIRLETAASKPMGRLATR